EVAVEVRAGDAVGLALVEVPAQPDVAVGQGEQRLRLGEQVEVEPGLGQRPRLDREPAVGDHRASPSRSPSSVTTTSAPWRRSASASPERSTPTTKPKCPA